MSNSIRTTEQPTKIHTYFILWKEGGFMSVIVFNTQKWSNRLIWEFASI